MTGRDDAAMSIALAALFLSLGASEAELDAAVERFALLSSAETDPPVGLQGISSRARQALDWMRT